MFSLEYTIFNINTKITLNFSKSAAMRLIFKGLKNEFDSVVVNESSVFETLRFYCIRFIYISETSVSLPTISADVDIHKCCICYSTE